MNNLWLKIRIWTKTIVFALILIYVLLFMIMNRHSIELWVWFTPRSRIPLALVILVSLLLGVAGTVLVRTTLNTFRQFQEMRERERGQRLERDVADMKAKASRLQTREQTDRPTGGSAES